MIKNTNISKSNLLPLGAMARRVHVPSKWLRNEAETGRIPHLKADTQFLFNPDIVENILVLRAKKTTAENGDVEVGDEQ